jgi:hypothetical protein
MWYNAVWEAGTNILDDPAASILRLYMMAFMCETTQTTSQMTVILEHIYILWLL